ncbi:MAG: heavy-metal-associated domain-containing protein [Flavobacteriaceae bacterium]|jgi:copper chaperone CopZ|nr:heavy-metal-associated domain-containing protein [Flavobacteriaceae bacterium]
MKTIQILALLLFMSVTWTLPAQSKQTKKTKEVTFAVNMHCHSCQLRIEKNVSWEKGIKDLTVNLEKKTVTIIYDPEKTTEEKLQKAIEKLDFTCELTGDD